MAYAGPTLNTSAETLDKDLTSWVRITWLGWTLGLVFTIAAALAGEAVGVGASQTPVGLGMGGGVGLMQGRAMKGLLRKPGAWLYSTMLGIAAPFLIGDLSGAAGLNLPYSLYLSVALGGLLTGIWQAALLEPIVRNAKLWVFGSVAGWSLAAAAAALADRLPKALSLRGLPGAGIYLVLTLGGGLVLGLVTGTFLNRLNRRT